MININLKNLSNEELQELFNSIKKELEERKPKTEFTFNFEATNDPRKGIPYVARLFVDDNGKLQRQFFNMSKNYGKKEVTISGKYTAKAGDIIEIRTGGSWKNDYRSWYCITEDGEKILVADIDNSQEKAKVEKYLKGEITAKELLE